MSTVDFLSPAGGCGQTEKGSETTPKTPQKTMGRKQYCEDSRETLEAFGVFDAYIAYHSSINPKFQKEEAKRSERGMVVHDVLL